MDGKSKYKTEGKGSVLLSLKNIYLFRDRIYTLIMKIQIRFWYLTTKCEINFGHDYTRIHNEVVRSIHLALCNKFEI